MVRLTITRLWSGSSLHSLLKPLYSLSACSRSQVFICYTTCTLCSWLTLRENRLQFAPSAVPNYVANAALRLHYTLLAGFTLAGEHCRSNVQRGPLPTCRPKSHHSTLPLCSTHITFLSPHENNSKFAGAEEIGQTTSYTGTSSCPNINRRHCLHPLLIR